MSLGETIETLVRETVYYCHHNNDPECAGCPFKGTDGKHRCKVNMSILEDLVHFTDTEIIPDEHKLEL